MYRKPVGCCQKIVPAHPPIFRGDSGVLPERKETRAEEAAGVRQKFREEREKTKTRAVVGAGAVVHPPTTPSVGKNARRDARRQAPRRTFNVIDRTIGGAFVGAVCRVAACRGHR
ncbi:hypothetical protein MTP99_016140 [Tenebrio molitor]|nr:hypothetical protein MTP99_016140 [Tenebrio molitor]